MENVKNVNSKNKVVCKQIKAVEANISGENQKKKGFTLHQGGFSLLEVILALSIVSVLAYVVVGQYGGADKRGKTNVVYAHATQFAAVAKDCEGIVCSAESIFKSASIGDGNTTAKGACGGNIGVLKAETKDLVVIYPVAGCGSAQIIAGRINNLKLATAAKCTSNSGYAADSATVFNDAITYNTTTGGGIDTTTAARCGGTAGGKYAENILIVYDK